MNADALMRCVTGFNCWKAALIVPLLGGVLLGVSAGFSSWFRQPMTLALLEGVAYWLSAGLSLAGLWWCVPQAVAAKIMPRLYVVLALLGVALLPLPIAAVIGRGSGDTGAVGLALAALTPLWLARVVFLGFVQAIVDQLGDSDNDGKADLVRLGLYAQLATAASAGYWLADLPFADYAFALIGLAGAVGCLVEFFVFVSLLEGVSHTIRQRVSRPAELALLKPTGTVRR